MARDFVKFLRTLRARILASKQVRASGWTWISSQEKNIYLCPAPRAAVRCLSPKPKLDHHQPGRYFLSHRYFDHGTDVNVIIEAIMEGGFSERGFLFTLKDAFSSDPVILKYLRCYLEGIEVLEEGKNYTVGEVNVSTPPSGGDIWTLSEIHHFAGARKLPLHLACIWCILLRHMEKFRARARGKFLRGARKSREKMERGAQQYFLAQK